LLRLLVKLIAWILSVKFCADNFPKTLSKSEVHTQKCQLFSNNTVAETAPKPLHWPVLAVTVKYNIAPAGFSNCVEVTYPEWS